MDAKHSLKYPIGLEPQINEPSAAQLDEWIYDIESFPFRLAAQCEGSTREQLNWRYRPEGWTLKQLVHHCADSHLNAFIRFKLAITEENPTIRPYAEALWAETSEAKDDDIAPSLQLIEAIHHKWTLLLKGLNEEQWQRSFYHPEHQKSFSLKQSLASYAWHCRHHLAHFSLGLASGGKY